MSKEFPLEFIATSKLSTAASDSDIIITCTPSKKKYLMKEYIKPGTFIAAIGADSPDKQELDETLIEENKIVCDILE